MRLLSWLRAHARPLVLVGIACSLALAVVSQWDAIRSFDWRLAWLPFLGAVCLFSLGPLAGGTSFWLVLRDLSPQARFGTALWIWERSFAARYIPGGAMTVAVRMLERERLGATRAQMISATAYEQAVAAAAAAAVSLAAFAVAGEKPPVVALVVLGVVLVLTGVAQPVARWWMRQRELTSVVVRTRTLASALVLGACSWLVAGAAAWVFVDSLAAADTPAFAFLLGAYTFAWLIGFVVPFAPSGLGVREATLIALLAPSLGVGPATAVTVGLRLANVAGDFLAIGAIEAARWLAPRWRRASRSGVVGWELR
jgi:glycosyltransferase 2 family protein